VRERAAINSIEQDIDVALDLVAGKVRERTCILFLGAGVHAPPPPGSPFEYPVEQRPPLGGDLSQRLADEIGLDGDSGEDPRKLARVALFYEIARSRRELVRAVAREIQDGKHPSPLLGALARLDFPIVVTTNFDRLFERALAASGKEPRVSVYTRDRQPAVDFRDPTPDCPIVFKVHGDVDRAETMVLTDEDYIEFVLRMSDKEPYDPIPLTLKYHLKGWTTLFIGYSLLDYNLRLLFKTLRWKVDPANVPDMYSVDSSPDPLIFAVWHNQERYVKFIAQDAWKFVPRLYEAVLGTTLEP
jgi:hypothetical protein